MHTQTNEVEVLKEMVKSANMQAKTKDIDINRLKKKIARLEKMNELGKGVIQEASRIDENVINEEEGEGDFYETPNKSRDLGINPANYSVEDEVQM